MKSLALLAIAGSLALVLSACGEREEKKTTTTVTTPPSSTQPTQQESTTTTTTQPGTANEPAKTGQ